MTTKLSAALALGTAALMGVSCTNTSDPFGTSKTTATSATAINQPGTVLGQVFGTEPQQNSTYTPGTYQSNGYSQENMDYVDVTPISSGSDGSYEPPPSQTYQPPAPTRAPAPRAPSSRSTHTVQKGDTLYSISRRHGTSVAAIQSANNLSGTIIHPGKVLTIR